MKNVLFSVIIVCLNPGRKLQETVASVKRQTFRNFEIVVKDGGSTDGAVLQLTETEQELLNSPVAPYMKIETCKDRGIYDAMNQAVSLSQGEYVLFLNCGDKLYDENVLKQIARAMDENPGCGIYYGDTFCEKTKALVAAPRKITGFTCYRNIPCHQACFYHRDLLVEDLIEEQKENQTEDKIEDQKAKGNPTPFNTDYRIRADYDHFLKCFYRLGAKPMYAGVTVASYEGGGFSESRENRERDKLEHTLITKDYMSKNKLFMYKTAMVITLAPLRRLMAESPLLSGMYQSIKRMLYGKKDSRK